MNEDKNVEAASATGPANSEEIPAMQRMLDNPFLLLVLGITVPAIFYIIWGIIEITQIPIAD